MKEYGIEETNKSLHWAITRAVPGVGRIGATAPHVLEGSAEPGGEATAAMFDV